MLTDIQICYVLIECIYKSKLEHYHDSYINQGSRAMLFQWDHLYIPFYLHSGWHFQLNLFVRVVCISLISSTMYCLKAAIITASLWDERQLHIRPVHTKPIHSLTHVLVSPITNY